MTAAYLVASDFSPQSRRAVREAFALARRTRARVEVFCALSRRMIEGRGADADRVRALLEDMVAREGDPDVAASATVAVADDPSAAILRRARAAKASLVVVAPHGATGWRRILLGSIAQKVVRGAACSVLVARPPADEKGPVLAGVALGASGKTVLRHAIALARSLHADLDVCHVVKPFDILVPVLSPVASAQPPVAAQEQQLARMLASAPHRGVRASARVLVGSPAETLVGEARRQGARFVVVGATSKSRVRGALLGNIAHAVAGASESSVLVVRGPGAR